MPQSFSSVYIHLVFSTKERRPFLRDESIRNSLHLYFGGISKRLRCAPVITGGVEDHVHHVARLSRTMTQAEWVKELKRVSSLWMKEKYSIRDFEWQGGQRTFPLVRQILNRLKGTSPTSNSITGK